MFSLAPILLLESQQLLRAQARWPPLLLKLLPINLSAFVGTLFVLYLSEQAKGM